MAQLTFPSTLLQQVGFELRLKAWCMNRRQQFMSYPAQGLTLREAVQPFCSNVPILDSSIQPPDNDGIKGKP